MYYARYIRWKVSTSIHTPSQAAGSSTACSFSSFSFGKVKYIVGAVSKNLWEIVLIDHFREYRDITVR